MRIAITGSAGYVGNFLAEHFSSRGHAVVGLDLLTPPHQRGMKNFKFIACDVRDPGLLGSVLTTESIDHVIHLAYLMDPQHDARFEYDVDVNGSKNVFRAAHAAPGVKQFVHCSSASIYGGFPDNRPWIPEEQEPRPRAWVYAQNKKLVEDYCFAFPKRTDFRFVNLRMCTAVGPSYHKPGGVVAMLAKARFRLLLDGRDTLVQFIHEDDVKALFERVLGDDSIEGTYNLAPDSYAAGRELVDGPRPLPLKLPKALFRALVALGWHLRLSDVSPTSVDLIAHGIIVSPRKLMKRYGYRFSYSTKEAFLDAVRKRRLNGTL